MITTTQRMTAIGVFETQASAQRAVNELRQSGFLVTDIGVASQNAVDGARNLEEHDSNAATGAVAGAATGAGAGALWGLGIAAGLLPGIGPVIAGGTLAAILASAATGAAAAGIVGTLVGLGFPEDEAKHYEAAFRAGRTIVTVKAPSHRYSQAMEIMDRAGAVEHQYT